MLARFFGTGVKVALGAGGAYLAKEVYQYRQVQESIEGVEVGPPQNERPVVTATKKEWLMFGRQSPGYVRDEVKTPKHEVHKRISMSSLWIKQFGTEMDNEKHFNLFPGSDFVVQPFTTDPSAPNVVVPPEKMLSTELDELDDSAQFEVGFARKRGFADWTEQSPLYHSSLGFRVIESGEEPAPGAVTMSGAELKDILKKTDTDICKREACTMYSSNCYTASVYSMAQMIQVLDERPGEHDRVSEITAVAQVLRDATRENLGRGVTNNDKVRVSLTGSVHDTLLKYDLVKPTDQEQATIDKGGPSSPGPV